MSNLREVAEKVVNNLGLDDFVDEVTELLEGFESKEDVIAGDEEAMKDFTNLVETALLDEGDEGEDTDDLDFDEFDEDFEDTDEYDEDYSDEEDTDEYDEDYSNDEELTEDDLTEEEKAILEQSDDVGDLEFDSLEE